MLDTTLHPENFNIKRYISGKDSESETKKSTATRYDYAYILRYQTSKTCRQPWAGKLIFHVAGFTQHGTAMAGHYLAQNWHDILTVHMKSKAMRDPGDGIVLFLSWKAEDDYNLKDHDPEYYDVKVVKTIFIVDDNPKNEPRDSSPLGRLESMTKSVREYWCGLRQDWKVTRRNWQDRRSNRKKKGKSGSEQELAGQI